MIVLGMDPGFASFGVAALDLTPEGTRVCRFEVLRTAKDAKKNRTLATEDNVRRCRQLAAAIERLVAELRPVAIAAEAMSFPRSSSVAGKMCLAWGAVVAVAERHELPIVQASPQRVKEAIAGRKDASKAEIEAAMLARWPGVEALALALPRTQREHPFDALAVAAVALDSDVMRAIRAMGMVR